ncbi:MAG: hypothetical protein IPL53_14125 [Ignavibacteria bacterium]|nr:hypothetical protein [Ignavibacteria bacterium]
MNAKKIRMRVLLLLIFFAASNVTVFSQNDSMFTKVTGNKIAPSDTASMTCEDLKVYLSQHPDILCNVDFNLCAECLGVQGDVFFDTTQSTTDNLSRNCLRFFNQVSICLSLIRAKETEQLNFYLMHKDNKESLTGKELEDLMDFEQNGLIKMRKLISQQEMINNYLIKVNSNLIDKLENCEGK